MHVLGCSTKNETRSKNNSAGKPEINEISETNKQNSGEKNDQRRLSKFTESLVKVNAHSVSNTGHSEC